MLRKIKKKMLITPFLSFFHKGKLFFGDKLRITMRIKTKTGITITVDSRFRNNTWTVKNVNVVNNAVSLHTFSDNFHRYSLYASS